MDNNLVVQKNYDPYVYDPYVDFGGYYVYGYDWYNHIPTYPDKTDFRIKQNIKDELWWSPYVDLDDVTITVDKGVATLTGTVDSWLEYGAAQDNAYEGGAVYVDNQLTVKSS